MNDEMKEMTGGIDQMPVYYSDHNIISIYVRNKAELLKKINVNCSSN